MKFNARKFLGLAISDRGITAVEVAVSAQRRTIVHLAELHFTDDVNLEHPARAGDELRQALRKNGISTSRCVVGVAACWLASKDKQLPAVDAQTLRSAIQIATEREFASGAQDLVFDFTQRAAGEGIVSLIVALQRRIFDQIAAMTTQAGLTVTSVTPSALMAATATKPTGAAGEKLVLCLGPGGAELAVLSGDSVRMLRHLPGQLSPKAESLDGVVGQLRMILSMIPSADADQARELIVWDSIGLEHYALEGIGKRLGASVRCCSLHKDVSGTDCGPRPIENRFAQAAALASGQPLAIDFANSRLAPARKPRVSKRTMWISGIAAAVLITVAALVGDLRSNQSDLDALKKELAAGKDATVQAREMVEDVNFARGWYDRRPPFLECLAEIARAFPDQGIWATNVTIKEDMQVTVTGTARDEGPVLDLFNRLNSNRSLSDVKPSYIRQVGGASKDVTFAISFTLHGGV